LQILTISGEKGRDRTHKSDLGKIDKVTAQIRKPMADTAFSHSLIIPTSVRWGEGKLKILKKRSRF